MPCETLYPHLGELLVSDDIWNGRGLSRILAQCLHELWASTCAEYRATGCCIASGARLSLVRLWLHHSHLYICVVWLQREMMEQLHCSSCLWRHSSIRWGLIFVRCCHSIRPHLLCKERSLGVLLFDVHLLSSGFRCQDLTLWTQGESCRPCWRWSQLLVSGHQCRSQRVYVRWMSVWGPVQWGQRSQEGRHHLHLVLFVLHLISSSLDQVGMYLTVKSGCMWVRWWLASGAWTMSL